MDSLVVDTALGIIFIFGTFALLISIVTELISRFIGLRGEYLLRGIRSLPSYLSGRTFARAVVDLVVPDSADGATTIDAVRTRIDELGGGALKDYLLSLTKTAPVDLDKWRQEIEHWYDDEMGRVSGWYKRHVRWISLGIGVLFVLAFNLNSVHFARALYTDQALRESVVSAATAASDCGTKDPADCLRTIESQISTARGAGLPIGWGQVTACVGTSRPCGFGYLSARTSSWSWARRRSSC